MPKYTRAFYCLVWIVVLVMAQLPHLAKGASTGELTRVTFLPHWVSQAQFAGYYVAHDKGFYTEEGLEVEILMGGPDAPSLRGLVDHEATFTSTFLSTALQRYCSGADIVNICQLLQRSALLLITKASSGIRTPHDFQDRTITIWSEFDAQPRALFRKFSVEPRILPQRYSMNLFLRGGADVTSAMWYNEYHRLINAGLNEDELVIFKYEDYGLNFPEDGIYCLRETLDSRPELCRSFVSATVKGWLYAFEHPEEALDIVMAYVRAANIPSTRIHQKWMLKAMQDLMLPEGSNARIGYLPELQYQTVARELLQIGLINKIPPYEEFYENCNSQ